MVVGRVFLVLTGACQFGTVWAGLRLISFIHSMSAARHKKGGNPTMNFMNLSSPGHKTERVGCGRDFAPHERHGAHALADVRAARRPVSARARQTTKTRPVGSRATPRGAGCGVRRGLGVLGVLSGGGGTAAGLRGGAGRVV